VVRKATAQDVADLAGVSRSAVSLVLNGRGQGNIARDKQQAIIEAARQLNYTPNAVALSLRNRRSRTIGVLTWPGAGGFAERMLHAALQAATSAGYLLIFMDTANDRDHQNQALATLHDHQVDALLVIAPDLIEYRPMEAMSSLPTILVNCLDPNAVCRTSFRTSRVRDPPRLECSSRPGIPVLAWLQDPPTRCRAGSDSQGFRQQRSR
jgi:LacI family transcriptional regulator